MKYIDSEKLIAEIERRIREYDKSIEKYSNKQKSMKAERDAWKWAECKWFLNLINSLQREQPERDITEFEKVLDDFGEAYATLVDRDNNPNQGIRINAYHELVRERVNEILSLAKEYVKQEQPDLDLEEEIKDE